MKFGDYDYNYNYQAQRDLTLNIDIIDVQALCILLKQKLINVMANLYQTQITLQTKMCCHVRNDFEECYLKYGFQKREYAQAYSCECSHQAQQPADDFWTCSFKWH